MRKNTNKTTVQISGGSTGLLAYETKRNAGGTGISIRYLLGILITAVSLSFGAPFWFDLLVKFVNIRRAGNRPAEEKPVK